MSGDSRDYYHSSRRTHRTRDERDYDHHDRRDDERGLPSIRDVVGDQLDAPVPHPAYNLSMMNRALPEVSRDNYPSQPGPMLPPIARQEYGSQSRPTGHEHRSRHHSDSDSHYHRHNTLPPNSSSSRALSGGGRQPTSQGSYHVFAQSDTRGELITVSSSSTPHGIMRDRNIAPQSGSDDPRKKFECPVCGRRMERQSVYNQHMITHTDERPHICAICGKSFNSKSNLNRHVQTHGSRDTHADEDPEDRGGASSSKDYYSSSRRK